MNNKTTNKERKNKMNNKTTNKERKNKMNNKTTNNQKQNNEGTNMRIELQKQFIKRIEEVGKTRFKLGISIIFSLVAFIGSMFLTKHVTENVAASTMMFSLCLIGINIFFLDLYEDRTNSELKDTYMEYKKTHNTYRIIDTCTEKLGVDSTINITGC